jgi:hypothetical protein
MLLSQKEAEWEKELAEEEQKEAPRQLEKEQVQLYHCDALSCSSPGRFLC